MKVTAPVALSAATTINGTSAHKIVLALVVAPDAIELTNTRPTVAVVDVGAVAVGIHRTLCMKEPFIASAVNAKKISVATVPPPCELVLPAVTNTLLTLPFFVKIGSVFPVAIFYP